METALGRRAAQAAAVVFGPFTLGVGVASAPLDEIARQPGPTEPVAFASVAVVMVPAVAVGTLLAARRPGNPIGWLLLAIFLLAVAPAGDYAVMASPDRHHAAGVPRRAAAGRPVAVILVTAGVLALAATATATATGAAVVGHAVIISASGNLANKTTGLTAALQGLSAIGALVSLLAWLAVQVPRYRRASDERRQQLKWLYSGAAISCSSRCSPRAARRPGTLPSTTSSARSASRCWCCWPPRCIRSRNR